MAGGRVKDSPHSNCQGIYMKLHTCYKCVRGLDPAPACSLVDGSVSVSTHGPRLVDRVGLLVVSLIPLVSSSLCVSF